MREREGTERPIVTQVCGDRRSGGRDGGRLWIRSEAGPTAAGRMTGGQNVLGV